MLYVVPEATGLEHTGTGRELVVVRNMSKIVGLRTRSFHRFPRCILVSKELQDVPIDSCIQTHDKKILTSDIFFFVAPHD